jgi:hypothetical protein
MHSTGLHADAAVDDNDDVPRTTKVTKPVSSELKKRNRNILFLESSTTAANQFYCKRTKPSNAWEELAARSDACAGMARLRSFRAALNVFYIDHVST